MKSPNPRTPGRPDPRWPYHLCANLPRCFTLPSPTYAADYLWCTPTRGIFFACSNSPNKSSSKARLNHAGEARLSVVGPAADHPCRRLRHGAFRQSRYLTSIGKWLGNLRQHSGAVSVAAGGGELGALASAV